MNSRVLLNVHAIAVFLVSLLLFAPVSLFDSPISNLDSSWKMALNLAFEHGWTFGEDTRESGRPAH